MNAIHHNHYAFATPVFLLLLAALCSAVWLFYPRHKCLLWQTCGYVVLAVALTWHMLVDLRVGHRTATAMATLYLLSQALFSQAIAQRLGRHLRLEFVAPVCGLAFIGIWYFSAITPSLHARTVVISLAMALVLSHVLPSLWKAPKRHVADRALVLIYAGVTLSVWLRPLGLQLDDSYALAQTVTEIRLWWLTLMGILFSAALYTAVMVGCTWLDAMFTLRTERDQDALTGLLNRRAFQELCSEQPHLRGLQVLVLCDLDFFKHINDRHGHAVGDDVLREFGKLLRRCCRETDVLARIGGEEFALALPRTTLAQAQILVERIQTHMQVAQWSSQVAVHSVTASFGMVELLPNESLHAALRRADQQLYAAKRAGRNRLVVEADTACAQA